MNKKLIAVAIAGAFVAPAAMADTSNVTIYGVMNVAVENVGASNATSGTTYTKKNRMSTGNNSAIGFKGVEDLGNGLSAIWQIETNVSIDGNASASGQQTTAPAGALNGTRNVFAGLSGKTWGSVTFGVQDTPYKTSTGPLDLFVATLGDYNSIMGARTSNTGGGVLGGQGFDLRTGNSIQYSSPNFSGFNVKLQYAIEGEQTTANTSKPNVLSASLNYANGPIFATLAHEQHNNMEGTNSVGGGVALLGSTVTVTGLDEKATKLGFGYNFGPAKVGVIWEKQSDNRAANAGIDRSAWHLNGAYTIGKTVLKAAYTKAGKTDSVNDTGATQWAVGADYNLSKRTKVYALYSKLSNKAAAAYGQGQGTGANGGYGAGADPKGFGLGMQHSF